jgi:hypothetical protein
MFMLKKCRESFSWKKGGIFFINKIEQDEKWDGDQVFIQSCKKVKRWLDPVKTFLFCEKNVQFSYGYIDEHLVKK